VEVEGHGQLDEAVHEQYLQTMLKKLRTRTIYADTRPCEFSLSLAALADIDPLPSADCQNNLPYCATGFATEYERTIKAPVEADEQLFLSQTHQSGGFPGQI
jgi:hypothetical protein